MMTVETRIVVEKMIPDSEIEPPYWMASIGAWSGTGANPMAALSQLLDKILKESLRSIS